MLRIATKYFPLPEKISDKLILGEKYYESYLDPLMRMVSTERGQIINSMEKMN